MNLFLYLALLYCRGGIQAVASFDLRELDNLKDVSLKLVRKQTQNIVFLAMSFRGLVQSGFPALSSNSILLNSFGGYLGRCGISSRTRFANIKHLGFFLHLEQRKREDIPLYSCKITVSIKGHKTQYGAEIEWSASDRRITGSVPALPAHVLKHPWARH